jgi:hypothetical protein
MGVTLCSLRKTAVNSNLFTSILLILLKVWEFLRLYCIIRIPKLCQSPAPTPKVQISKGTTPQNTTPEGEKLRRRRTLLRQARRGRNNEVAQSVIIHVNSLNFLSGSRTTFFFNIVLTDCFQRLYALLKLSDWALSLEIQQNK